MGLAVLFVALVLCTYNLGSRPFHRDEAVHAVLAWKIATDGPGFYTYESAYHGPLPYYASAVTMWLLGDSDTTARVSAAIVGILVLAFAIPLRRYLGRWGACSFLLLLTFSPTWIYFARFLQHDIFLAACLLAAVTYTFRYGERRQARDLYLVGLALGLAACTKGDAVLLGAWCAMCLVLMVLWGVVRREQTPGEAVSELRALGRQAAVPFLTSSIIFVIVWLTLHTSFFTHNENWRAASGMLDHWLGPESTSGAHEAGWYYLPRLLLYEPLVLFPALAAIVTSILGKPPPSRFTRFLILWALGSLSIYTFVPQKDPSLLVLQILPLALLAASWIGDLIERGAFRRPAIFLTAAVGLLTLWSLINVNFVWNATRPAESTADQSTSKRHAELLAPPQSTYDITEKVITRIEEVGASLGTGTGTRLVVSGQATWPLSWYLRKYPVKWVTTLHKIDTPIIIVDRDDMMTASIEKAAGDAYERIPFQLTGGWEPDWSAFGLRNLWRFLLTREAWSEVDGSAAVLYVCKDLSQTGACPAARLESPATLRATAGGPSFTPTASVWGKPGSGRGEFNEPRDLATDLHGGIFVVDSKNHRIQKLNAAGEVLRVWGQEGSAEGEFKDPGGVAVAPDGTVYVADTWNHRIQQFDTNGNFLRQWSEQDPPFWGPRGVAVATDGTVFVTDTGNKRVRAYTAEGKRLRTWGSEGSQPGQFIEPVGIAVDETGQVIVADTGNHRLQFFRPDGTFVKAWPVSGWEAFYTEPYIDTVGDDVYVTDSNNQRFARYSDGKLDRVWGDGEGGESLNRPIGIATGGPGVVYVSDTGNHQIRRFLVDN